jgi:hypothetical protein
VMIAYGEEFPEFAADYLAAAEATRGAEQIALESRRGSRPRVSSPHSPSNGRASFGRPMAGEEQGGGSEERPSVGRAMTAPTRGGGRANGNYFAGLHPAAAALVEVARLENAWVEAYHSEDAGVASVGDLAALNPDCLPNARIAFHPAARLLRFATPAASIWASAQNSDHPAALVAPPGEDALIARPDCDVRVRVLPPLGFDFALQLRNGATLIEALTTLDDPAFDFGTHLVGLVESGAVASIIVGRT